MRQFYPHDENPLTGKTYLYQNGPQDPTLV